MNLRLKILLFSFVLATPLFAQIDDEIIVQEDSGVTEVFDLPEGMAISEEELMNDYTNKSNLTEGTTSSSVRELSASDQVIVDRLSRIPTTIEMPLNNITRAFIDKYSNNMRSSVAVMLGASNFYMPIFEEALERYGLPLELKYLPVIESALRPSATSRAGAAGLWQFMVATGKRYGLRITTMIDERRDPVKSSYAAAHYLSDLYKIFGDWNLVIAAYNYGPENINKAIRRAGGVRDYWQIYPYLPNETRGYVPAFIAANYIMNYYCEHNICPMLTKLPVQTDTVMLSRDVHFEQLSNVIGISKEQLRSLNPQYRRDVVTGYSEPTDLRLPIEYINSFIEKEDSVYAYNADQLLKRAEVAVNDDAPIYRAPSVSQRSARHSARASRKARARRARGGRNVTIRNGDTLSEIAKRNHTTVAKLKKLNRISGSSIRAGKQIRVR
jgi:membrane-bound lytic murein transglycosylase D